ncbi:class I SAM-dependent methyltransferase [Streptantibioticus ferralitis]|uniref:Class I SAM-dependent methyltransferase n=1 Tax=Streptantibioticus ferralitis TaxID=236510 RepID=A0ABT5YUG3_9ACTN|nr:class I SAM-dependent methyltransferase [Streptantibioticus ferralitis]MDF2255170.1 class I SAM-dependent methyltransferase [Streptantibioticus ferralitis]
MTSEDGHEDGDLTTEGMLRANARNWDARTPVHVASDFYGLDGSRSASDWFAPFEWEDLGELHGRDVVHLQCHLGTESQAFADRGAAHTVGLDFSGESIVQARRLAAEAGRHIEFVQADVHQAVEALDGRRFDVVYTGKGALCYLPDLCRWAEVVGALLRPGGLLYVVEFHPLLNALGPVPHPGERELLLRHDYLGGAGPIRIDSPHTYTDGPPLREATTSYEWRHGIGETVGAVTGAGLRLDLLRETGLLPWKRFGTMVPAENGWWRLPEPEPRIPLLFALRATKPG